MYTEGQLEVIHRFLTAQRVSTSNSGTAQESSAKKKKRKKLRISMM